MIVIVCDNFRQATICFEAFRDHIIDTEPWIIENSYDYALSLETDDNLRYIFIDYRYIPLYEKNEDIMEFIDVYDFF